MPHEPRPHNGQIVAPPVRLLPCHPACPERSRRERSEGSQSAPLAPFEIPRRQGNQGLGM